MTDSTRFSAAAGHPTPVDDGTPAGLPTPAGEPTEQTLFDVPPSGASLPEQPDPDSAGVDSGEDIAEDPVSAQDEFPAGESDDVSNDAARAIGALVMAWGALEAATAHKLVAMRRTFGDVRALGGRSRPSLQRLLAELRALVAMRDRHDKQALTVIAALESDLQRLAQFRSMIVEGTQRLDGDQLICLDHKNAEHEVPVATIFAETSRIDVITQKIAAL